MPAGRPKHWPQPIRRSRKAKPTESIRPHSKSASRAGRAARKAADSRRLPARGWNLRKHVAVEPLRERERPFTASFDEHAFGTGVRERYVAAPPCRERAQRRADPQLFRKAGIH